MAEFRQRSTPKALLEENENLGFRESFSKFYKENPPDFTVKKDVANRYGVLYFLVTLFLQYYVLTFVIVPHLIGGSTLMYWRIFSTIILVQSFYNWSQCIRKYVNKAEKRDGDSEKLGWKLCHICQYYAPPRSHHCKLCKACILRQDHHCFFAAGCIGHFTTFYFVALCFWLVTSQVVALYWTIRYLSVEFTSWYMLFPLTSFWASLTGSQSWFHYLIVCMTLCMFLNIFVSIFYLMMSSLAATGNVTFYEGSKGVKRYKKESTLANVRAAWGAYYWIRWLIPFYVDPEGDGYEWKVMRHTQ